MSSAKKRKYNDDYIKYGFICMLKVNVEHHQCVICDEVLSNKAMRLRPNRLERHLSSKHNSFKDKPKEFFVTKSQNLKRMKLDTTGSTAHSSEKVLESSYEQSLLIAKENKSHINGETLVKPCVLKTADSTLGTQSKQKLSLYIPLSDNTVKRRTDDMAEDIQNQVVDAVKQSPFFAIKLAESADIAQCSQLIVYVRYIENKRMKDEPLFSTDLQTATKAVDVMKAVSDFFDKHEFSWQRLIGGCTDGTPSMLGSHSGFVQLVREKNAYVTGIHCFIYLQALAAKTLPNELNSVLKLCIKVVNNIKNSALNIRLFKTLCEDLGSDHKHCYFIQKYVGLQDGKIV
ncbi:protein FAM200C-like [Diabrotica undecimpunctata]|uniref:protein FAM200C-like n=1 Tax=Diabrotica undecimpunctata TaxID=50387 RepID=UPI003B640AD4